MLWRIVAPRFVAGLIEDDYDYVSHTAPILRRMRGWPILAVRRYAAARGWSMNPVIQPSEELQHEDS